MNPEQVNTAVDRHGLSGCLPPVAPVLHTGVPRSPRGPAKAAAWWAGWASQARREAGEAGELSSHPRRLGASTAERSSAEQQKSIQRREASRGCPASPAGLGAQGPSTNHCSQLLSQSLFLSLSNSPSTSQGQGANPATAPHAVCVYVCARVCVRRCTCVC